MNVERQTNEQARETALHTGATSGGVQYAKAPSMLWFIVPMAALLVYGFLSR
jgi:hypothetical protein